MPFFEEGFLRSTYSRLVKIEKKLFVYAGNEHKHAAQNPEVLTLKY